MRLTLLLLTWYQDERVVGDFVATPGRGHYRIHCLQISGRDTYLVRWHRSQQSSAVGGVSLAILPTLD
jgi:hypothetical protein